MDESIKVFYKKIKELMIIHLPKAELKDVYKRIDKVSLRILIDKDLFVDIYSNTQTSRIDFTLVNHETRIFGYDNAGGWLYHPLKDPDSHIRCDKITLEEMFQEVSNIVKEMDDI